LAPLPEILTVARLVFELAPVTVMPVVEFVIFNSTGIVLLVVASAIVRDAISAITGGAPGRTVRVTLLVVNLTPSVAARLTVVPPTSPAGTKLRMYPPAAIATVTVPKFVLEELNPARATELLGESTSVKLKF
jgi:hypothetical protein